MQLVFCMQCGQKISSSAQVCPHCGAQQVLAAASPSVSPQASPSASALPEGVKGWSWGAFWLSWIWAIFNKTWIGLLALIPLVNLIMMVVLGFKGREWAWKNKAWPNIEHFNRVQKKWSLAGWISLVVLFLSGIAIGVVEDQMKHRSSSESGVNGSLYEDAGENTSQSLDVDPSEKPPLIASPQPVETSPPQTQSPYPMPNMSFGKIDLLGGIKRAGMDSNWVSHFTKYMSEPEVFLQECIAQESDTGSRFGGMGPSEAQSYGETTCQSLTQHHYDCLSGKTLDDAVMCLQTYINNVEENGN